MENDNRDLANLQLDLLRLGAALSSELRCDQRKAKFPVHGIAGGFRGFTETRKWRPADPDYITITRSNRMCVAHA